MPIPTSLMPRVISPKTHAFIDYICAGTHLVAGAVFLRRNRRAATAAFTLGAGVLVSALLTDYPGGVFPRYSFRAHRAFDYDVAGISAVVPRLLDFQNEPEAKYFEWLGSAGAFLASLTDYDETAGSRKRANSRRRWGWEQEAA